MTAPLLDAEYDVIVVGAGNAALTAALSAREQGAKTLVLEKAPRELRGGNTKFTGWFRFTHNGLRDTRELIPDISDAEAKVMDVPQYSQDDFYNDIMRVTAGRADPHLTEIIVTQSKDTVWWMAKLGVKWELCTNNVIRVGDRLKFPFGYIAQPKGGGAGLVDMLFPISEEKGAQIAYGAKAVRLLVDTRGRVYGVTVKHADGFQDLRARKGVVLGCGGFEANPELRARYLGPGWDTVKVRGTRFNTGEGLFMALAIGAQPAGHWTGAHACQVGLEGPDIEMDEGTRTRHGYTQGILVNVEGRRFLDEGEDLHMYTYAKFGKFVLAQPQGIAFQIYDAKITQLPTYYGAAKPIAANSIPELANKLGIDQRALMRTVEEFNNAVQPGPVDHIVRDGRRTEGISPPKSNWAQAIDSPPFRAYPVTCGITFTFGGLKVNERAQVVDTEGSVVPGLYATGEVAGTFFYNYPAGTGLMKGAVFGRIAGAAATTA